MIKKIIVVVTGFFYFSDTMSQTPAEWQSDLRYLQQIVHSKYNNLFYNISDIEWDKKVNELYTQIPSLEKEQVLTRFMQLLTSFHIGHTSLDVFDMPQQSTILRLNRVPCGLYFFSDGVHILMAADEYKNAVGGKVLKIGNLTIDDALEAIRPLVPYENEQGFKNRAMLYLTIPAFLKAQGIVPRTSEVAITWKKNGKTATTIFKATANTNHHYNTGLEVPPGWTVGQKKENAALWRKEPAAFRYMQFLPETKTLYVRHSVTADDGDKTIEAFFNNMVNFIDSNDVVKLVLDVRTNEGGDNYLNKPIITGIIRSKKINQKGRFFCIIGRRTFSAAQNLVNELERYTEVIFAGEPTGENVNFYADVRTEILPYSKLKAQLSWLWWQNMDPRDKRKATSPALAADMSFSDYYNNVDPAMNVIENYDSRQAPVDEQLILMVLYGKYDEAISLAGDYIKNPLHRYYINELETKLNNLSYEFINDNRLTDANRILAMNVRLFPQSVNACYNYAESFMLMGKRDDAIKYFELALAIDKNNIKAHHSKMMISNLKSGISQ